MASVVGVWPQFVKSAVVSRVLQARLEVHENLVYAGQHYKKNMEEIAQAIEYLITHPEEARKMGENGRRAVEEKYNWEKEAQKLLALYEQLLVNPG